MKRLRHPVRAIREPFGTAGLIVACVALVLALTGAAFAAGGLTGKQKKEVTKIAKKYAGKPGAAGPAGAAGPVGPAGAKGDTGAKGDKGDTGDNGSPGAPGTPGAPGADGNSVEKVEEGPTVCAGLGGVVYEIEESGEENEVCNGKQGPEGALGTAGTTLPAGVQETGNWFIADSGGPHDAAAISFPIKLSEPIEGANIHIAGQAEFLTFCQGAPGNPAVRETAPALTLCVFEGISEKASEPKVLSSEFEAGEASKTGAFIEYNVAAGGFAAGSFAVKGG